MGTCLTGIKEFVEGHHSIKEANKSAKHHSMFTNDRIRYNSNYNERFHNML